MRTIELTALTLASILLLACQYGHDEEAYSGDATGKYDAPGVAATDCEQWCDVRAPREAEDGFCRVGEPEQSCEEACNAMTLPAPSDSVLQECIEDDALCFIVLEDCVAARSRLAACTSWCDFRSVEHADEGFCEPFVLDSPDQGCVSTCIGTLAEGLPAAGVEGCVRDNPLCFVDLETCSL